jgi:RNA recognition motif-containing protein
MLGKRSALMVFFRGLPENTTRKELRQFVIPAIKNTPERHLALKGSVLSCTVLRLTDPASGAREFHGLVEIQPAKAALHAIALLNGQELGGRRIEVRRYQPRSAVSRRRLGSALAEDLEDGIDDERRRNLKIDLAGT